MSRQALKGLTRRATRYLNRKAIVHVAYGVADRTLTSSRDAEKTKRTGNYPTPAHEKAERRWCTEFINKKIAKDSYAIPKTIRTAL